MNNQSFRDLLKNETSSHARTSVPSALGAKKSSFVPMTPRPGHERTSNTDFARQVRERNAALQPTKKFKSSAPMGSKLGAGYTDRAKARAEAEKEAEAEKTKRIEALREQVRLGTLSQEGFEDVRVKIVNGDDAGAPRVKGLDRTLLEKTRRGEDVLGLGSVESEQAPLLDVDEELERLGEKDVQSIRRDVEEKVGVRGTRQVAGVKRSRDQIMAELKAKRQAAARDKAASATVFDPSRWRKVGEQAKDKVIIDSKGREVLITVDEDGIVKRKVRKLPNAADKETSRMLDKSKPVLGADVAVPELRRANEAEESEEEDIFAGVGAKYNPLGEENSDHSDSDDDTTVREAPSERPANEGTSSTGTRHDQQPSESAKSMSKPSMNYFKDSDQAKVEPEGPRFKDVENIIKKAAQIGALQSAEVDEDEKARRERHAKMMARDRDLDDMDMGFGSSRFEDDEDGEDGRKARLSEWKQGGDGWEKDDQASGKRKRKPKKRKGDVNNADDIMRVLEGRRKGA